jgi:hypothetical protein
MSGSHVRRLANLLIVMALVLRGLLPVGFMLASAHGDGGLEIVICTAQGPLTVDVSKDGLPLPATPKTSDDGTCPFAASTPSAVAVTPWILSPPRDGVSPAAEWPYDQNVVDTRSSAPPPARGPPLHS